jgi:hypothetical protein
MNGIQTNPIRYELATSSTLLYQLLGQASSIRIMLYADSEAILVVIIKKDIRNLSSILQVFGEVTNLVTK